MNSRSKRKKQNSAQKRWEKFTLDYLINKFGSNFKKPSLYKLKDLPSGKDSPSFMDFFELSKKTNENK